MLTKIWSSGLHVVEQENRFTGLEKLVDDDDSFWKHKFLIRLLKFVAVAKLSLEPTNNNKNAGRTIQLRCEWW